MSPLNQNGTITGLIMTFDYFDAPVNYHNDNSFHFYTVGSSPHLLEELNKYLIQNKNRLESVFLSWYIFNNGYLHDTLKQLALAGVKIDVVTMPLEGYESTKPKKLIDLITHSPTKDAFTKYELARTIFREHYLKEVQGNYNLYIFPHIYIRSASVNSFSRGNMPYSLHIKFGAIKFKNTNEGALIITSSSFAVRDLVKEECMSIIETDDSNYLNPALNFANEVLSNSTNIQHYNESEIISKNIFAYSTQLKSDKIYFIAPFYYNSGIIAEEILIDKINAAKKRIWCVSQHLAAIDYPFDGNFHTQYSNETITKDGMLRPILDKAKEGLDVKFISQTFCPTEKTAQKTNTNFRSPQNTAQFQKFSSEIERLSLPNIEYYVNENVHSKYIIVDNELFICSFNFTGTPFTFLDNVVIPKFKHMDRAAYQGVFSEVGVMIRLDCINTVQQYEANFIDIIRKNNTCKVFP